MRKIILVLLCLCSLSVAGQKMSISGNVQDTVSKTPLQYSVVTAVRIKDSVLAGFTRTDAGGHFEFKNLNIDTVQITVSNPRFGDQTFYVFGSAASHEFDFGKIILPPKSQQLNEVVIYAFKDPVYYKGDTLVYTADSFKVKPNATVEDLLKKLPGIKVDAEGKITSQGKEVSQVLVDGDEFFGADPTVATKNLAANGVESVQVYEKKNDNAVEGGDETIQVMNLKLKDEAKKGYFGKVSGASDLQNFYEGELLANKFRNKQKISVFALGSNTPRSSFGWGDMYKYGLNNEMNTTTDDEGNTYWYGNGGAPNGIPQTFKSGFYYTDRLSKKTKITANYTYSNNLLKAQTNTHSQYFLSDTSYVTDNLSESTQRTEGHSVNLGIVQTLDSLTELEITPKFQYNTNRTKTNSVTDFLTGTDTLFRSTDVENTNKAEGYNLNTTAKLTRKFKKKDRFLMVNYNNVIKQDEATGILKSNNTYFTGSLMPNDSINQEKLSSGSTVSHLAKAVYTEPLTKKIKLEFEYVFNYSLTKQTKEASNYVNGEYSAVDSNLTNDFENVLMLNKAGLKFLYETKKMRFAVGSRVQQREVRSNNLFTDVKIKQSGNSVLPYLSYGYRFSENKRLNFNYYTSAAQPSITQLQPVPDNTNPNQVYIGNAALKQSFTNRFELTFNTYKPLKGSYIWANINYGLISNAFANSTAYDSIGRAVTQTVNVDGNYYLNGYMGGGMPFFSKMLTLNPSVNYSQNANTSFINGAKNLNTNSNAGGGLSIDVDIDTLRFTLGANYTYNTTKSSLNTASSKPYSSQQYNASLMLKLPFKFMIETDAQYTINSQRTAGYNINYILWNASVSKMFLRNENLIVSLAGNDLLNQNINTNRDVQDNVITDTKTNIISRYFLLKVTFKFNSTKTKDNDDFGF